MPLVLGLLLACGTAFAVITAFTYVQQPNNGAQQLPANTRAIPTFNIQVDTSNDVAEPTAQVRFFDQAGTLRASPVVPRNTPSPSGDIPVFEGRTQLLSFAETALTPFPPGFPGPTTIGNRAAFVDADTGPPNHPQIRGLNVTNGRVVQAGNRARIVYNAANRAAGSLLLSAGGIVETLPRTGQTTNPEVLAVVSVEMVPVQFSSSIAPEQSPKTTETGVALVPFSFPIPAAQRQPGEFDLPYDFTQVPDGIYELRFTATDVFNQASPNVPADQTILTIDKDTRAPQVVFTFPSQRPAFIIDGPNPPPPFQGETFRVSGLVSDERGLATTVTLEITNRSSNTQVVSTQATSAATLGAAPFSTTLNFSDIVPQLPPPLPAPPAPSQELYRILARATDQAGNPGPRTDSIFIVRDFVAPVTPEITAPPPGTATDSESIRVTGFVTNIIGLTNFEEHGFVDFEVTLQSQVDPSVITTLVVPGLPDSARHSSALDNGTTSSPSGPTYTTFPIDVLGQIPNSFSFLVFANISSFPDGRVFINVRAIDQVGNRSPPAFESFLKGPVGPAVTLNFADSGPDDNYDPISGFPPNQPGANDNLFFISLKSPEIADNGTGVPVPIPPFTDPGTQNLVRLSGTATDINTPVARVEANGAGVPTVSVTGFAPSTTVNFVFDPNNNTGINVSALEEGLPALITITGFNASGQSGVTSSILVFRDVIPARRPLIDFPAEQPFFTGRTTMRLEGRAEPGSLVAVLTPPTTGIFVLPIPRTLPNRIPRRDSQFNSIPPNAQTTLAGPDGKWSFVSLDISTVATGITQPTTVFVQSIDTFDNTDPAESVEPFEIFRQDVPGDIADITIDPFPGGRNVSVFPIPPVTPVFTGLEVLTFRVTYNTLLVAPPRMTVQQFGAQQRDAVLLTSRPSTDSPTSVLLFRYDVLNVRNDFDGRADLNFTSGLDIFGRVPNPTPVGQAFIVDSVPPALAVSGPEAFSPPTGTQAFAVTTIQVDLLDPTATNGSGTASGLSTTNSRIRLFGPLERVPASEVPLRPVTATSPFDLAAEPVSLLTVEGTYEVRVEAEDRVANPAVFTSNFILDRSAIPTPLVRTDPADGSFVSTLPRFAGDSGIFAFIDDIEVALPPPTQPGQLVSTATLLDPTGTSIGSDVVVVDDRSLFVPVRPPLPTDGSRDGVYTIEVEPVDQAGNVSPIVTNTFTYDTVSPLILDVFPEDLSAVNFPLREVRARVGDGIPPASNPFPPAPSGMDLDRAFIQLTLLEPSFPNTTFPGTIVEGQRTFRTVPGSTIGTIPIDVVALEILDSAGRTRSLTIDGSEDGLYSIRVVVSDRAGNATTATSTFTFDTQPPQVSLDDFPEGSFLADTAFTVTGSVFDRGPAGFDAGAQAGTFVERTVQVRIEGIAADGSPITTTPFFDFRDASRVSAVAGARPTIPATDVATWSFSGTIPRTNAAARLVVRATDRAGNVQRITRDIQIRTTTLPPPELLSPPDGLRTRAETMRFLWKAVVQARRYELELLRVEPATPSTPQSFFIDHPNVELGPIDLVRFLEAAGGSLETTRDNVFEWRMRSVDVTKVNTGVFSAPFRFIVDLLAPATTDTLIDNVSTGGNPVVGQGQHEVRIDLTDSGGIDLGSGLNVTIQPEDLAIEPRPVDFVSFTTSPAGATWRGSFTLPFPGIDRDNNGQAFLAVRGGADLAGNPLPATTAPFRINLGPSFDARAFANPVEPRELVLVVRSFPSGKASTGIAAPIERTPALQILSVLQSLDDPAMISLSTTPTVRVGQQGSDALTQLPVTQVQGTQVPSSAFSTSLQFNPRLIGVLDFQVTGTDSQGATATRDFALSVALIVSRAQVTLQAKSGGASLELPAGSVEHDTPLWWVDAENAAEGPLQPAKSGAPAGVELVMVRELGAILPVAPALKKKALLRVPVAAGAAKSAQDARRPGLCRFENGRWRWLGGTVEAGLLSAEVDRLGRFAVMTDASAPAVAQPYLEKRGIDGPSFRVAVSDLGSGVDGARLAFEVDGSRYDARHDAATGEAVLVIPPDVPPGEHEVVARVADRAGNEGSGEAVRLHVSGYEGLGEVLAVPNPARRGPASIRYRLLGPADSVRVRIYDVSGTLVETLDGPTSAGLQRVDWDFFDAANGVYLFRVEASGSGRRDRRKGKLVVLR